VPTGFSEPSEPVARTRLWVDAHAEPEADSDPHTGAVDRRPSPASFDERDDVRRERAGANRWLATGPDAVGAGESKEALVVDPSRVPYLIVRGRIGGSAMTAAAVNALARTGL